jgi:hypothetical protein
MNFDDRIGESCSWGRLRPHRSVGTRSGVGWMSRDYYRCSGSISGVDFSPGRDCFLSLRSGLVDMAALGILVDDCPGGHQSDCGRLRADAAAVRPVAHCCEHECCRGYPPLCADSDRPSHAFPLSKSFTPLPTLFPTRCEYAVNVLERCIAERALFHV